MKRIHLTRHAEAEHNVEQNYTIPDAKLTELGKKQSRELYDLTRDKVQLSAELLVCSPLRRPLETMVIGYADLKARLAPEKVIILDLLQEVMAHPCDTPTTPPSAIASALGGIFSDLDFSGLAEGYASKKGIFDPANAPERARQVRQWLKDRPEQEIVVVAHGDINRQIAYKNAWQPWGNAETKIFTFGEGTDLVEIGQVEPESETHEPTSGEMK